MDEKFTDPLYAVFEYFLLKKSIHFENDDEFVACVVDEYVSSLSAKGCLPFRYLDGIREELANEVYDMLLKKTYGHFNLSAYRQAKIGRI